jgi:hypothetical protein
MGFDDFLIAVVVGGIALSGTYIRSEYRLWRSLGAAERRRAVALRELHAARLSRQHDGLLDPAIARLESFAETGAPIPEDVHHERRSAAASPQRNYLVVERRARQKRHATQ